MWTGAEHMGVSWPVVINVPLNLHNAVFKVIDKNFGLYATLIVLNRNIFIWGFQIYLNMLAMMIFLCWKKHICLTAASEMEPLLRGKAKNKVLSSAETLVMAAKKSM